MDKQINNSMDNNRIRELAGIPLQEAQSEAGKIRKARDSLLKIEKSLGKVLTDFKKAEPTFRGFPAKINKGLQRLEKSIIQARDLAGDTEGDLFDIFLDLKEL